MGATCPLESGVQVCARQCAGDRVGGLEGHSLQGGGTPVLRGEEETLRDCKALSETETESQRDGQRGKGRAGATK